MKRLLLIGAVLSLASCASLQYAGSADYSVKPFKDADGKVMCCAVDIHNGKEIANLEAHITKTGDDYTVDLKEQGVAAFAGQQISANAVGVATKAAVDTAIIAGGVLIAPVAAPLIGGIATSGGLGAAAVGVAGGIGATKVLTPATKVLTPATK